MRSKYDCLLFLLVTTFVADVIHVKPHIQSQMLILLVIFFLMVAYHARLVEVSSRLDFLWKQQAESELQDMLLTRSNNTKLLENILPNHVARHYLSSDRNSDELYSQYREEVGVMFASIPNFTEFYSEHVNKGVECIRLLNEIIADFDELLDEERFSSIEKIKTVSATATYMAASGLNPIQDQNRNNTSPRFDNTDHLCALIDFALLLRLKLEKINEDSFNNFGLRVGISCGPLICGVIGARKPVFDIWGNTVNEASRMDSTGIIGHIQVPKQTAMILRVRGYNIRLRGVIEVKGKGPMETYFIAGRQIGRPPIFQRQPSHHNSLAAVMYNWAQSKKKQISNSSGISNGRAKFQYKSGDRKNSIHSSLRVSQRTAANPVRRNTTRTNQKTAKMKSPQNARRLTTMGKSEDNSIYGFVWNGQGTKTNRKKKISRSAPHTPVKTPSIQHQLSDSSIDISKKRTNKIVQGSSAIDRSTSTTERRRKLADPGTFTVVPLHTISRTLTLQKKSTYYVGITKEKVSDIKSEEERSSENN